MNNKNAFLQLFTYIVFLQTLAKMYTYPIYKSYKCMNLAN